MKSALILIAVPLAHAGPLTYDNRPLGTVSEPRVLRTYVPDPDLEPEVFDQHDKARTISKYSPNDGRDVDGEVEPRVGIPAAVAVNFGPNLSYVFDTTECRLLYAWQGGFLDMLPYWGEEGRGSRRSFDYVPRLVGTLIYKTSGPDPVELDGKSVSELGPRTYKGYSLDNKVPVFEYSVDGVTVRLSPRPIEGSDSFEVHVEADGRKAAYRGAEVKEDGVFRIQGESLASFEGFVRQSEITEASVAAGEELYTNYGCLACHSLDGSAGHGPTLVGLAGSMRPIVGGDPVLADRAYLIESIREPNAVIAEGYPPNYMPKFPLKPLEYESLALYIESIPQE